MGNVWVLDSIFFLNQWDLSLYAFNISNQDGKWMSVFYTLCTIDKNGRHEGIVIALALSVVFADNYK